ncbi:hypothetical protein [Streptosporangium sp. NPDC051022]|uniref:hypothetical protein n=1 Tax=Streptosporangium sp. NPDC051022 TaxID=3155752 RepID=UPI003415188F
MADIPDAPPGWFTAEPTALHNARTDGGLRARIAATLWNRDYQPGPEAEIGGYIYDIADRVAGLVEELREQVRAEERAAIARMVRHYFAAADDPLYEDVRILCGRIERGEHA